MKALLPSQLLIVTFFLFSCRTEIEFKPEECQSKIVINSVIYVDSLITCYVHRTNFALESNRRITPLPDALVQLEIDGVISDTLTHVANGKFTSRIIAQHQKIYRFIVSREGFPTASAQSSVLTPTQIISLEKIGSGVTTSGTYFTNFRMTLENDRNNLGFYAFIPLVEKNYFAWDDSTQELSYLSPLYIDMSRSRGIEFSKHSSRIRLHDLESFEMYYFTDKLTSSGNTSIIELTIEHYDSSQNYLANMFLLVEKLSEDFFLYEQSLSALWNSNNFSLFSQSIQVFNNVDNGMGIVGTCLSYPPVLVSPPNVP